MTSASFVIGARFTSPIGIVEVEVDAGGALVSVSFVDSGDAAARPPEDRDHGVAIPVIRQIEEYFAGRRRSFELRFNPRGTEFERRVWKLVGEIPFGSTTTYGAIARQLGDSAASRAVGIANARNPIAIVIPCHRVIGADGDLTGYAGGMWRKRWLLAHESGQQHLVFE